MTIVHVKRGQEHFLIDDEVYAVLKEMNLERLLKNFSLAHSADHEKIKNYHRVGNHLTDGEKVIVLDGGIRADVETIEKTLKEIPIARPHIVFYEKSSISTFIKPGKVTFFAKITRKNVKLFIPGGEANLPRSALPKLKISSISPDLFEAVIEHTGSITTRMYDRTAYSEAVEKYGDMTIVPLYDIAAIIGKKSMYIYDGEKVTLRYPFESDFDLQDFVETLPLSEIVKIIILS